MTSMFRLVFGPATHRFWLGVIVGGFLISLTIAAGIKPAAAQTSSSFKIIAPAAEEIWKTGSSYYIMWPAASITPSSSSLTLTLRPAFSGSIDSPYIITSSAANSGAYHWNVPTDLPSVYQGQMKIVATINGGTASASSPAFVIKAGSPDDPKPTPIVVSPAVDVKNPARLGQFFEAALTASGGAAPYSFAVTAGSLPPGLSVGVSSGPIIGGTPTTAGSYTFTITATDHHGHRGSANLTLVVTDSQPTNLHKPSGYLDVIHDGVAYGWSLDKDNLSQSNNVHFYIDGLTQENFVGLALANQTRPDVNLVLAVTGDHGFVWPIPEKYRDGKPHTLYAFALDLTDTTGVSKIHLGTSPKSFVWPAAIVPPTTVPPATFPSTAADLISHLYSCVLTRDYDQPGLDHWLNDFVGNNKPLTDLFRAFFIAPEYLNQSTTNQTYLSQMYSCILFREPDAAGYERWLTALNDSSRSRSAVLDPGFLQSVEFQTVVTPKLEALRSSSRAGIIFKPVAVNSHSIDPRLGVVHVGGKYPKAGYTTEAFRDENFLSYGAKDAYNLGFRTLEIYMLENCDDVQKDPEVWSNYRTFAPCSLPSVSLKSWASSSRYKEVLDLPLKTVFLTTDAVIPGSWQAWDIGNGTLFTSQQDKLNKLYQDFYDLTDYLLKTYKGTGKTFVLQTPNEMDWQLIFIRSQNRLPDESTHPTSQALENAKTFWNTVQKAVTDARKANSVSQVAVYHACEVNALNKAMQGNPSATNDVVPYTSCDLYGYSAWGSIDTADSSALTTALNYLAAKAPDSTAFGSKNVYISELGFSERDTGRNEQVSVIDAKIKQALAWGVPYILYWQLYDNTCQASPPVTENQCAGFWLRKPAGTMADLYNQVFLKH